MRTQWFVRVKLNVCGKDDCPQEVGRWVEGTMGWRDGGFEGRWVALAVSNLVTVGWKRRWRDVGLALR
jgi:hypothetical protein